MKNQFKKSLSLIMAVIMLMSCWVWIAPEKAQAYIDVTYSITLTYDVVNEAENGGHATIYYYPFNDDGSLSSTRQTFSDPNSVFTSMFHEANNTLGCTLTADIPGWPCGIFWQANGKGANNYEVGIKKIAINNVTVLTCNNTYKDDVGTSFDQTRNFEWLWDGSGASDGEVASRNWSKPVAKTITSIQPVEFGTIGSLPNGSAITGTSQISGVRDQYGVALPSYYNTSITSGVSYSLKDSEGNSVGTDYATVSGYGSTATVTIKPKAQTHSLVAGNSNGTFYLYANLNGAQVNTNVKFQNPSYTATFHANGGTIGTDANDVSATGKVIIDTGKAYYDTVIGKQPAFTSRQGYEFKGFYSSQIADTTGKTFTPAGTKFENNVTKVPDTGDTNWYAAWQSAPITATFMTADNQLIGTVEGRYNNRLLADNMYKDIGALNLEIKSAYDNRKDAKTAVSFDGNNVPVYTDGSTTYTFDGWKIIEAYDESLIDKVVDADSDVTLQGDVTFQATYTKSTAATYTVSFEDGNGNTVSTKSGYKYRDSVTNIPAKEPTKATDDRYNYTFIGWAKDIGKNFYTVDEADKDENGAIIVYTPKDGASFIVKGDASYVPVFRMVPREYNVTYNYKVDGGDTESTLIGGYHWHDGVNMPEIKDNYTEGGYRYYIDGWMVGTDPTVKKLEDLTIEGDMTLTAHYDAGEAAKYTINFYGKDTDGITDVLLNADSNIYAHNSEVTAPAVSQTIDTDDALYTFAGWSPAVNTTAGGDVDYYAVYTKKTYADIHFYNYDGTLIYETEGKENTLFVGEAIPGYVGETPVKPEDVVGTYTFTGWADGNGNPVVPGTDVFTGNTFLYAQFSTSYKKYTVKFVNEGTTVTETEYKYGEAIAVPADPAKPADVEYTYKFKYWSPDVSEICYGAATYTAVYERNPQYYMVTWLNDNKTVLSESNYKYNQKIQQAVVNAPLSYPDAATGKTWAFKHWVQCDENGNDILVDGQQVLFARGMRMGAEHLYFYPVFEQIDNVLTVSFYREDGTTLIGEAKIPYGRNITDYAEEFAAKASKAADDEYHYVINNWVNVKSGAAVTTIIADVSVKAAYTAEKHTKDVYDITIEPTCTETGLADVSCSAAECDKTFYDVVLDVIPDNGNPTGQIYVGSDKWTLTEFGTIDYEDVKYVGPNTNVIVNAQDTNTSSEPWNPEGEISRGVGKIDYYVSETEVADPSSIGSWTNVYEYEAIANSVLNGVLEEKGKTMQDYIAMSTPNNKDKKAIDDEVKAILANYNANATGILSNLDLVNGKEYIIYIRVSDREVSGESNKCYFSSGKLHYGSTAAEIAVSGDGYGTKFCAEATVAVNDDTDGFKVYLDGEEVTLTNGKFVCSTKGVHTVTVIDKNGNKTIKTFEIKGNHTYRNYTTAATCENAGSRYDLCTVCGVKANETPLPALGHSFTVNYIDKAADCINDGSRTYACDNNCGTKLVLKPTDDAETIAQAKKWVDTAGEDGKGAWVALTVVDLASLKATGEHTYAKVKDEDGEDTSEDAWIIDKAATCSAVGSKHKDCTVCGIIGRVTEEIPLDTENGHKFYREQVASEPLCQEIGKKTKICRYCGYEETTSYIPALGHVAGEYVILKEATCTEAGWAMLTCSRCDCYIGEGEYDPMKEPVAKKLDPLGHKWKIDGEVYSEEVEQEGGTITVWYQNYKCAICGETEKRKLEDYKPPVAATITFDFNGGYYTIPAVGTPDQLGYVLEMLKGTQAISTYVGETIVANDVEAAFKLNNATKIYTFSHWEDAEGKEVKFPIEVKGDATYYAVYTEKFINYTITYYQEDGITEFKKTGYLHNGEEVALAAGPAKAATNLVTYKFAGWAVIGTNPEVVYTDKVTIDGANINLKAKYTEIKKQYAVTYAYSKSDILETFAVEAGQPARDCLITPVKDADSKYHYEFKAWNKAAQLVKVESNIYTTPDFDPVLHSYTHEGGKVLVAEATCTTKAKYKYTCICGFSYEKEEGEVLGHDWGEPVYDAETGVNIVECSRCKVSDQDTRTFTAKFFVDATQKLTISYIPWGTMIDETRLPADPTKETTATTEYTFKGWAVKDDATQAIVDFKNFAIKKDCDFVAVFTETTRKYNVIFGYDAKNIIKTFIDVPAGSDVTFDLTEVPVKEFDDTYHYDFSGWKGYKEGVLNITVEDVQETLRIYAEFTKTKHDYKNITDLEEATCQNGAGKRYSCDCGAYYDVTGKPLDHEWKEIERVEATEKKDGYIKYECQNDGCDETKTETLTWVSDKITLEVKVLRNGEAQSNVSVQFVEKNGAGATIPATTGKDGIAKVVATKSDDGYACYVNIDGEMVLVTDFAEGSNGNYTGTYAYTVAQADCSCACHRDNFWGVIFRFIHKIIKFFTGEFKCCGNPDPMYG